MSSGITAIIIVVVLIAIMLAAFRMTARRRRLQQQFGPEYDLAVNERNSRIKAEGELAERQRRVRRLDIQPLSEAARVRYSGQWVAIQEEFVDAPQSAVQGAYELVTTVMQERGYPVDDDKQVMADLSVEHGQTVSHFRAAQHISTSAAAGKVATEDLRQAFIHYRALFDDLLGESNGGTSRAEAESALRSDAMPGNAVPASIGRPLTDTTTPAGPDSEQYPSGTGARDHDRDGD